jgi:excinuclease UvrABC helicase subunit UvrB
MMEATGSCAGIENYSVSLGAIQRGSRRPCSGSTTRLAMGSHVTVPQIGGMFKAISGARRRCGTQPYLPSCMDNQPKLRNGLLMRLIDRISPPIGVGIKRSGGVLSNR